MQAGIIRVMFSGANSCRGFVSLFSQLTELPQLRHIFIIKGGPGTGKSRLMREIGEELRLMGYNLEHFYCSSDPSSLDAIYIPALGAVMLDGTAPHIVDPVYPGALDQIINLLDYADCQMLQARQSTIIAYSQQISRLFRSAYFSLQEAQVIAAELNSYFLPALDQQAYNNLSKKLLADLLSSAAASKAAADAGRCSRRFFASAITPAGHVHHIDSLLPDETTLYLLQETAGGQGAWLLHNIAAALQREGFYPELYYTPLQPDRLELLVIPELRTALLQPAATYDTPLPAAARIRNIDLDFLYCQAALHTWQTAINDCEARYTAAFRRAINFIASAKAVHDQLEQCYIEAMDFSQYSQLRYRIIEQILT